MADRWRPLVGVKAVAWLDGVAYGIVDRFNQAVADLSSLAA